MKELTQANFYTNTRFNQHHASYVFALKNNILSTLRFSFPITQINNITNFLYLEKKAPNKDSFLLDAMSLRCILDKSPVCPMIRVAPLSRLSAPVSQLSSIFPVCLRSDEDPAGPEVSPGAGLW